jgi:Bacterial Ig domain
MRQEIVFSFTPAACPNSLNHKSEGKRRALSHLNCVRIWFNNLSILPANFIIRLSTTAILGGSVTSRYSSKVYSLVAACLFMLAVEASAEAQTAAYFKFRYDSAPETVVFQLMDPAKIEEARNILSSGSRKIISGTLIKSPVYYNAPWSFYLNPKSIAFVDSAAEVCDANPRYIEDHLSDAYPQWCPWLSRLVEEIPPPPPPAGNLQPAVTMTFPHTSNVFATPAYANVTVAAAADDHDGTISKIEFFGNGTKIGESSTHPYRANWNNLDVGSYTVQAVATDNLGATAFSRSVTFNVTEPTTNPADFPYPFVRQHYLDFLNREPDSGGLEYWSKEIFRCGFDQLCIHSRRIGVSAAFFIESEFQETGGFVYRLFKTSYGVRSQFSQFMTDRQSVVAGANLEVGKQSLLDDWVQRAQFLSRYPAANTGEQFIDAILQTVLQGSGVDLSTKREALLNDWGSNGSRGRILRLVADDSILRAAEYNRAFVLMQYFGYLRRDPDEGGYLFWLDILNNRDPNNYRG